MSLVGLLLFVLIAALVLYCAKLIIGAFNVPAPWGTVLFVVVVLIVLVWALGHLGIATGLRL